MITSSYMALFDAVERDKAQKNQDYYDGRGEKYIQSYINTYRTEAVKNGMTPFTRNTTKPVIDESGMLFSGRAPTIKVYDKGSIDGTGREVNEAATLAAQKAFEDAGWIEYFNNFDPTVRLNSTGITFVQIDGTDPTAPKFVFTALSQANAAAHFTPTKNIDTILFYQGRGVDGTSQVYALQTSTKVADVIVASLDGGINYLGESLENEVENPYGIVTAVAFHDTNVPVRGGWNPVRSDLATLNFKYNQHLTDSDYAIQWNKFQTLFTNAEPSDDAILPGDIGNPNLSKFAARNANPVSRGGMIGGPSRVVHLQTDSGVSPYVEYKGPDADLTSLDTVVKGWYRDIAQDWSVSIDNEATGFGGADSGFKLMVREIPNLDLRKKRSRLMEAGFKRLYEVMLRMSEVVPMGLVQNTELFIEFPIPELPIDEKSSELVWSVRIKEGRSSDVEYFMVQQGLSRDEAEAKVAQLAKDRELLREVNGPLPDPTSVSESISVVI